MAETNDAVCADCLAWRQSQGMVAILTIILSRTNTPDLGASPGEIHPINQIPKTVLMMNLIIHSHPVAENYHEKTADD